MSSRYKVMASGGLHITNANVEEDAGRYTCRGENLFGTVEQTTTIQLLSMPLIFFNFYSFNCYWCLVKWDKFEDLIQNGTVEPTISIQLLL